MSIIRFVIVCFCVFAFNKQASGQWFPTYIDDVFTLGNASGSDSPYELNDTFKLETNPGASKTIYLDFDGHHSVDNVWGHDLVFDSFDRNGNVNVFSNSELIEIQRQFQNVAEDFAPFDVNVTTLDPGRDALVRSDSSDTTYGIRVLNTQNISGSGAGGGGTAYLNSFNWIEDRDNVAFTFNKGENNGGMTNSHEIGHTLGLRHDGFSGGASYHPGAGNGQTGWGPIMGAPFGKNVTQWNNGDYTNSSNQEDDLAIITKNANGINYKVDAVGDTFANAVNLARDSSGDFFDWNIIEQNSDTDMFSFTSGAGQLMLDINAFEGRPNLDILANLFDSNGNLVASNNPLDEVGASFDLILAAGEYFLSIEGTGRAGRYSEYGSLGFYSIQGFSAVPEPAGAVVLTVIGLGFFIRRRRTVA